MIDVPPAVPTPPSPARWRAWVAWLVIGACVVFEVYHNLPKPGEHRAANQLRIKLTGQIAIGLRGLGQNGALSPEQRAEQTKQLLQPLEKEAQSPADQVGLAILEGELAGPEPALARIDSLNDADLSPDLARDVAALRIIYNQGAGALDERDREQLLQHQDYLGRVALSFGQPANSELRQSLDENGLRMFFRLFIVMTVMAIIFLASLALFVTAIVLLANRKIRRAYAPQPAATTSCLEGFAFYLAAYIALGMALRWLNLDVEIWVWSAVLILPLAMGWAVTRGASFSDVRAAYGWHGGQGWYKEIPLGVAGFLAGLPIEAVGLFLSFLLMRFSSPATPHPIVNMLQGSFWQIVGLYGLACVFAPVMEETMFRGALFHHLRRRWSWLVSAGVTGFIFAIIHPQGWTMVPGLGSFGIVMAGLREWRGSILAPMAAHACSNGLVLTFALLLIR